MNPLHKAALAYAARGVPVFPVGEDKRPLPGSHGHKDATTDAAQINRWYVQGEHNIATVPGASGLCVIDIDDKNGHQGSKSWAALCPEAQATLTVRTPSGGLHLYFKGSLPPSASKLGDGLDVRGADSYVLLPPSMIDGVAYQVINSASPAPLPPLIAAALVKVQHEPAKAPADVEVDPEGSEEWACSLIALTIEHDGPPEVGTGLNQRTLELAMRLGDGPQYGYTISEDAAVAIMLAHWSNADRIEETVRNAYRSRKNPLGCGQPGSASRTYDPAGGVRPYNPEKPQVEREEQIIPLQPGPPKLAGLINGGSIAMTTLQWLWPGWLAAGKLHILGGQAGAGKSTIGFSLLAQVTRGGVWPSGAQAPLGDVLIWSGEDDVADTILPRLTAAGGDRDRVWFPGRVSRSDGASRAFDPAVDMAGLTELVRQHPAIRVVLIDPIVSAVGQGDSHNNAETRRSLQPVVDFAVATGTAVLGITHFTKGTQGKTPLDRITGSLAFGAMSRIVWGAEEGETPDDPRKLVRIKSNIGRTGDGFSYTLQRVPVASGEAQRVVWGQPIEGSAQQLLQGGEGNKEAQAVLFLTSRLSNGAVLERDMRKLAADEGLTESTLKRAKKKLGVVSEKGKGSDTAPWYWSLPSPAE